MCYSPADVKKKSFAVVSQRARKYLFNNLLANADQNGSHIFSTHTHKTVSQKKSEKQKQGIVQYFNNCKNISPILGQEKREIRQKEM